ncbi:MAG: hypothetical protein LIP03_01260 [Bacteroidales bacterium]|nr:hypothetical protein [Bacteroidales bacterium]
MRKLLLLTVALLTLGWAKADPVYTATGLVTNFSGWADNLVPEVNATVESYDGSIVVKAFAGIEGYDLQVNHDGSGNVTELFNLVDGEVYSSGTSGYVYLYTGLDDYYCFTPYLSSGYCYCYDNGEGNKSYIALAGYMYDEDGGSTYSTYYIYWPASTSGSSSDEEPIWSATGTVKNPTLTGWTAYENFIPKCEATVECYDGYIIVRGIAGVSGYDMKVVYDAEGSYPYVTGIAPILYGDEDEVYTSGYVNVYTGLDACYCLQPYVGEGYGYCYDNGEDSSSASYLIICAYFSDEDGEQNYGAYYVEWGGGVSGISAIETESAADAIYYNLQGVRVENPAAGKVYIRVANGKVTKVVK